MFRVDAAKSRRANISPCVEYRLKDSAAYVGGDLKML